MNTTRVYEGIVALCAAIGIFIAGFATAGQAYEWRLGKTRYVECMRLDGHGRFTTTRPWPQECGSRLRSSLVHTP